MALLAATIGWFVAPGDEPASDSASSIEASAIHPWPGRSTGHTAHPTVTGSASPSPGATTDTSDTGGKTNTAARTTAPAAPTASAVPPTVTQYAAKPISVAPAAPAAPPAAGGGSIPGGLSGLAAGSMTQLQAWQNFRGSPVTVVNTFTDRSSWQTITNPWVGSGPEKFSTFNGTWVISQPFFPNGGGDMNSCANGAYSSQWASFGNWLKARGRPSSIVRLAWEFNGDWFPWSASKTNPTTWVSCFRQVVGAMRSTDPQVRIDWALNAHSGGLQTYYPGDQYVDIIGIDAYDMWPASPTDAAFDKQCTEATGLCSIIAFARAHKKQFSVPEWGLVSKNDTGAGRSGAAGGDNPTYVRKMYQTFAANRDVLAYESYFNDSAPGNVHSSLLNPNENPNSAATYASLW